MAKQGEGGRGRAGWEWKRGEGGGGGERGHGGETVVRWSSQTPPAAQRPWDDDDMYSTQRRGGVRARGERVNPPAAQSRQPPDGAPTARSRPGRVGATASGGGTGWRSLRVGRGGGADRRRLPASGVDVSRRGGGWRMAAARLPPRALRHTSPRGSAARLPRAPQVCAGRHDRPPGLRPPSMSSRWGSRRHPPDPRLSLAHLSPLVLPPALPSPLPPLQSLRPRVPLPLSSPTPSPSPRPLFPPRPTAPWNPQSVGTPRGGDLNALGDGALVGGTVLLQVFDNVHAVRHVAKHHVQACGQSSKRARSRHDRGGRRGVGCKHRQRQQGKGEAPLDATVEGC